LAGDPGEEPSTEGSEQRSDRPALTRVLVVANKTAATSGLAEAVRKRAQQSPCRFTLLVPAVAHGLHRAVDPEDQEPDEAEATLELAIPVLEDAAGSRVEGRIGAPEPLAAVEDAVNTGEYDEIIVSTLPTRVSRWLRVDLPSKVAGLGLPVTTVTARSRADAAGEDS
jgi:hypothetical protein